MKPGVFDPVDTDLDILYEELSRLVVLINIYIYFVLKRIIVVVSSKNLVNSKHYIISFILSILQLIC